MTNSSGMSRSGVKKQLSRIKEVNFRLSQVKGADSNLKSMQFDIGILAKCCEKLLEDNDRLTEQIKETDSERRRILFRVMESDIPEYMKEKK